MGQLIRSSGLMLAMLLLLSTKPFAQALPPTLHLAGVTQSELNELHTTIERLAEREHVSESALLRIAERLGISYRSNGRPDVDQIMGAMDASARSLRELENRLAQYSGADDPDIVRLIGSAQHALALGDLDEADHFLAQAADIDLRAISATESTRRTRAASTISERGRLARLQGRYQEAAAFYAQAANTVPSDAQGLIWRYLLDEAEVLEKFGSEGHLEALEQSIALINERILPFAPRTNLDRWVESQEALANASLTLSSLQGRIRDVIPTLRQIADAIPPSHDPTTWAQAQTNLASALLMAGAPTSNAQFLEESARRYRQALPHLTDDDQAIAYAGLGTALIEQGRAANQISLVQEGVLALRQGADARSNAPTSQWASGQYGVARGLWTLAKLSRDPSDMNRAKEILDAILSRVSEDTFPFQFANASMIRGDALVWLAQRSPSNPARRELCRGALSDGQAAQRTFTALNWSGQLAGVRTLLSNIQVVCH